MQMVTCARTFSSVKCRTGRTSSWLLIVWKSFSTPSLVTLYDFGVTRDGLLYYTMELLKGTPLSRLIKREAPLDFRRAVGFIVETCDSLQEAHESNILHRDLKPDNLFIIKRWEEEHVKVLDFGIAKLVGDTSMETMTKTGMIVGTPQYLSPEQALGNPSVPASDLYSLAIVLYEMLTGSPPFLGDTPLKTMWKHLQKEAPSIHVKNPNIEVPKSIDLFLRRALQKEPGKRPQTALAFRKALEKALNEHDASPETVAYKKLKRLPEAWHHLTLYLKSVPKQDLKAGKWLQGAERELERSHKKISLTCDPGGVMLSLRLDQARDGQPPASGLQPPYPCPLTWWFRPGKHNIYAVKEGYKPRTVQIDVRERGDQGTREIKLDAIAPEPKPPPVVATEDPGETPGTTGITKPVEPKKESGALGWVLTGSGAAVGLTGGILQFLADSRNEELHDKYMNKTDYPNGEEAKLLYDADYEDEVRPKRMTAFVLYGVGGAAMVAGVVLLAMNESPESDGTM